MKDAMLLSTRLEILKEAVYYITFECDERDDPFPFSAEMEAKEQDPYLLNCIVKSLEAGASDEDIKSAIDSGHEKFTDSLIERSIFEARRILVMDELKKKGTSYGFTKDR